MNKILLAIVVMFSAGALSGCETIRYTIAGPFVGMQKDMENLSGAAHKAGDAVSGTPATAGTCAGASCPVSGSETCPLKKADDWIKQNLW